MPDTPGLENAIKVFEQYLTLEEVRRILIESYSAALKAAITGATENEVIAIAQRKAAELVTSIGEQMRERMREALTRGLKEQLGVDGTARLLRDRLPLDANRAAQLDKFEAMLKAQGLPPNEIARQVEAMREKLVRDRAKTIAQTEMGDAIEAGNLERAKKRKATHKTWLIVQGRVCPICIANAQAGPILIDESFPSGHTHAPAHPRCRCTVTYLTDTGNGELDRAKQRADERERKRQERERQDAA